MLRCLELRLDESSGLSVLRALELPPFAAFKSLSINKRLTFGEPPAETETDADGERGGKFYSVTLAARIAPVTWGSVERSCFRRSVM